jgi:hypothetical protein
MWRLLELNNSEQIKPRDARGIEGLRIGAAEVNSGISLGYNWVDLRLAVLHYFSLLYPAPSHQSRPE